MLAFYSDDPSSIPPEVYNFSVKLLLKRTKNILTKRGRGWPIFLKKDGQVGAQLVEQVASVVSVDQIGQLLKFIAIKSSTKGLF